MGIGTILLDRGLITNDQLEQALAEQKVSGERLDQAMVRLGLVRPSDITRAIGEQFDMPIVDLTAVEVTPDVLGAIPPQIVFRQRCVPVAKSNRNGGVLRVATSDPFELTVFDELRLVTGCSIELVLADEEDLSEFIRTHYGVGGDTLDSMSRTRGNGAATHDLDEIDVSDEAQQAEQASVIKLVNELLFEAIKCRATDVHIEPYERTLIVRYRVDGVLQRANVPITINQFAAAIVSRIKIMANLNIAEKRKPQDGRITINHKRQSYDLRVSVIPMLFGEGVVLRILNKSAVLMELGDLGMPANVLEAWDELITRPHGILLVTGPTGSGKSTTLYASLNRIITDEVKAITVEDPVEYHVNGVNQIQVNNKVGLTFAAGLRSILRHDPDVVMIGEIRDRETAEAAVQASLTGHLVFSTLHTNDAPGALPRLLDMGVEPYLVASSIEGVLAQRLVRRICPECAREVEPEADRMPRDFELPTSGRLVEGAGCRNCLDTGYRGRIGVYEMLRVTDETRTMVMQNANAGAIAKRAHEADELTLMRIDGYAKVRAGITTIDEVMRVTRT
ncbi:MAG: Flp pilus assembly complex ATPase component TadA [Phycisphaeraceae bacterium]|nr:Flp pilus assembly complex ATPase component TadA [Phycisphaerales bacterium]MCB9843276.1 Flp pilus assembly complex ATPase component TadA [Phycisphaeraceae bacterium]